MFRRTETTLPHTIYDIYKINFNIVLPSMSGLSNGLFPSDFLANTLYLGLFFVCPKLSMCNYISFFLIWSLYKCLLRVQITKEKWIMSQCFCSIVHIRIYFKIKYFPSYVLLWQLLAGCLTYFTQMNVTFAHLDLYVGTHEVDFFPEGGCILSHYTVQPCF